MFVCLSAGYTHLIDPHSIHVFEHGKKSGILSARGPYRKIHSAPPTRLPLRAKTYATLISFYNFFLKFFFFIWRHLLIKSLWRYMLLYICNKYKRLIKSLTTSILLYICNNKYKRLIESLTRYILLYICNKYKRLIDSLTTCILLYICNKYKKTYRVPNEIYLIIYLQ